MKLAKSYCFRIHDVDKHQWIKTAIAQNMTPNLNMCLGSSYKLITVDYINYTKKSIPFFMPLHQKYFMYFGRIKKLEPNEKQIFIRTVLETNLYNIEINHGDMNIHFNSIDYINTRVHDIELLKNLEIYITETLQLEYSEVDPIITTQSLFYNPGKSHAFETYRFPLVFNIVDKPSKVNIVGFFNEKKVDSFRITIPSSMNNIMMEEPLKTFRSHVMVHIQNDFEYPPFIIPPKTQYLNLCELYKVVPSEFDYAFLLKSNYVSRYCLYPFNVDQFMYINTSQLEKYELDLLSHFYDIPYSFLRDKNLGFLPIPETARSILLMDNDLLFHRSALQQQSLQSSQNVYSQYIYTE